MNPIDADALIEEYIADCAENDAEIISRADINSMPTLDVVPRSVYDQVCWERDTALEQLKEIGKSLGEKMDNVRKVQNGHWIPKNIRYREPFARNHYCSECGADPIEISDYCPSCGAKMSVEGWRTFRANATTNSQRQ